MASLIEDNPLPKTSLTVRQAREKLAGWHFGQEALSQGEREILYVAEALLRWIDQKFVAQEPRSEDRVLAKKKPEFELTDAQWNLLLAVAKATEMHYEPPLIRGGSTRPMLRLVHLGLLEPEGKRCTDKGWFFVRDEISSGRRTAQTNVR